LAFIHNSGSQTTFQYDPWADINDDGYIDGKDISYTCRLFGTTGDPTKPVIINNKVQSYSFSKVIPPRSIASFNVSTAGYRQATIILRANNSIPNGSTTSYLETRTGFLIDKCYTFSDWFAVTETYKLITSPLEPPLVEPQIWLEPTYIRIDNPNVGYKFNITARVHEDFWHPLNVSAWQIYFEYPYNLEITRVFEPKWDPEYIFYNKTTTFLKSYPNALGHQVGKNSFAAAAILYPWTQTPARGNGKLCIIEFSIKYLPKTGEQPWILNIDNKKTYLLDPEVNEISAKKYNAVVQWGYDSVAKTIQVIGPILIIECYNHNENESIEVSLEIYLTT
jgi:hypothetical protein